MQQRPNSSRRQFLGLAGGAAVLGALPVVIVRPAEATPGARVLTRTAGRQPGLLQRCGDTVCPPGTCDHDDRLSLSS